jgi:dTDP-4-dehydrorhamnose 3,5-epimerase-like enzyme
VNIHFLTREGYIDPQSASLGVLEFEHLPFEPKRAYWISDFKEGATRGFHAHKNLNQIMILLRGSIDVFLYKGTSCLKFNLKENSDYLVVPSGHWREMKNASHETVLLVLADSKYDESDYIRSWPEYIKWHSEFFDEG